mmetsp:Transcript_3459/g.11050  ORF Transcript_3459/g.11050 Transcript_3459/m.11050 type:complete len:384 (-) Transcript_3459:154-1305(-)
MSSSGKRGPISKEAFAAAVKRIDEQLEHAKASKAKLEERSQEYDDLKGILERLPEKVTHPVMVPFGPLAFFEGYLEHTNEVLTQLSSEWFALRTTTSALGMVSRRKERLCSEQVGVARELGELQMRRHLAVGEGEDASVSYSTPPGAPPGATVRCDEEGFLDIREPIPEDDGGNCVVAPVPPSSTPAAAPDAGAAHPSSEKGMLERLRELERMEELQELEELDELVEGYDHGSAEATASNTEGSAMLCPAGLESQRKPAEVCPGSLGAAVRTPADIFAAMSRVEQEAASAASTSESAEPGRSGPALLRAGAARAHSQCGFTAPPGASRPSSISEMGFAGNIRERSGPAEQPEAAVAGCVDAMASSAAPKRISKFKVDRQRARS